jgi:hypothetical protein
MALVPDKNKRILFESDVDPNQPAWNKANNRQDAYDLALYEESSSGGTRGVLEVTMTVNFTFLDTAGTWTSADKDDFRKKYKKLCEDAWSEQHKLLKTSTAVPLLDGVPNNIREVGVIFNVDPFKWVGGHWEVTCRKVSTSTYMPGTSDKYNRVDLESVSLDPATPDGAPSGWTRIPAVHEMGHMLGYQDEYPNAKTGKFEHNGTHPGDTDSILYWKDKIYPRHYVLFADWLSQQWTKKDPANCKGHDWMVNGTISMLNASL